MRLTAIAFAASFAALLLAAPPALAERNSQPDRRVVQKQELVRVRSQIQDLKHQIKSSEDVLSRVSESHGHDAHSLQSERMHQLECKIVDAETRVVELRDGRRYTEHHPEMKSAVAVLDELRRLRRTEVDNANRAAAAHRSQIAAQGSSGRHRLAMLRSQLESLTVKERKLVASTHYPQPAPVQPVKRVKKVKKAPKPQRPDVRRDDRAGDGSDRRVRAQPGVEARLARLEKAVKDLMRMMREREKGAHDRRAGEAREADERGPDVDRGREEMMKLKRALEAERQESEELRRMIRKLEERVHGERKKAERGEEAEFRRVVNELEKRLHGEREESEELREMVRHLGEKLEKAERGERVEHGEERGADTRELRGHVRGLERRLKVEQHENAELREVINDLEAEIKAFRKKLERR